MNALAKKAKKAAFKKAKEILPKKLYSISKRNALKEALPSAISSTATRGNAPTVLSLPYIT